MVDIMFKKATNKCLNTASIRELLPPNVEEVLSKSSLNMNPIVRLIGSYTITVPISRILLTHQPSQHHIIFAIILVHT